MAPRRYTPVNSMGSMYGNYARALNDQHVLSLEQLIVCGRMPETKSALMESLGVDQGTFNTMMDQAIATVDTDSELLIPATDEMLQGYQMGIRVTDQMLRRRFESRVHPEMYQLGGDIPRKISHIDKMQPIRYQGERGSCVAFGVVAAVEFHFNETERLSEQYAYWAAKMRDNAPNIEGSNVEMGFQGIKEAGICSNMHWSYCMEIDPGSVHQGPPDPSVRELARERIIPGFRDLSVADVNTLKAALTGGANRRPAIVTGGFLVYNSWFRNRLVQLNGEIPLPVRGEVHVNGHCMAIVGYCDHDDDLRYPGGGYFVVRNSWSTKWASMSEDAPGYARIPYAYITEGHMPEAYMIYELVSEKERFTARSDSRKSRLDAVRDRLNQRESDRKNRFR